MEKERGVKQVLVMRKDLNMRKGKYCAQAAHASMKAILDLMKTETKLESAGLDAGTKGLMGAKREVVYSTLEYEKGTAIDKWLNGNFKKIVVSVDNEIDLVNVYRKAKETGLICVLIKDAGLTEFHGIPTLTGCAIGPAFDEEVDDITGNLSLL